MMGNEWSRGIILIVNDKKVVIFVLIRVKWYYIKWIFNNHFLYN